MVVMIYFISIYDGFNLFPLWWFMMDSIYPHYGGCYGFNLFPYMVGYGGLFFPINHMGNTPIIPYHDVIAFM